MSSSATVEGKRDWQVTATTVKCQFVDEYAVLMVYGDGATKCVYLNKWINKRVGKKKLKNCQGIEKVESCPLVTEFRGKALSM